MNSDTFLIDMFEQTFVTQRNICQKHAATLRSLIRSFSDHLRRHSTVADLTAENINAFLLHQQRLGRTARTLQGYRLNFISFAKVAQVPLDGGSLRRYRQKKRMPEAWSMEQLWQLLSACDDPSLDATVQRYPVKQGDYIRALMLTAYDSGLRAGDLFALRREQIGEDGRFSITQSKTECEIARAVRPETLTAIDRMHVPLVTVPLFGFCYSGHGDYPNLLWRKLLHAAGFQVNRRNGLQRVRRSSATHLERTQPGSATWHLGHDTPTMAKANYLDERIIRPEVPLPPPIQRREGNGHA